MPTLGFLKKKWTKEEPSSSGHHHSSTISNIISHMPGHHGHGSSQQQQQPQVPQQLPAGVSGISGTAASGPAQAQAQSTAQAQAQQPVHMAGSYNNNTADISGNDHKYQDDQLNQGSYQHSEDTQHLQQQQPQQHNSSQHPLPTPPTSTSTTAGADHATDSLNSAHNPQSHYHQSQNDPNHTLQQDNLAKSSQQHEGVGQAIQPNNLGSNTSQFGNGNGDNNNINPASLGLPVTPVHSVSPGADPAALLQQQQAAHPPPQIDAMQVDHHEQQPQAHYQSQEVPLVMKEQPQQQHHNGGHHHLLGLGHHHPQTQAAQPQQNPTQIQPQPRVTKGKYTLVDFEILRTLGTGSFGRVHLVQSKHNQRYYAIKVLKKTQVVKMKQIEHTNDERRMLSDVKHPFLITLWGTFQDWKNLYMVMDFVEGGELFSLLRKSGRFPNPVAKFYAAEVALALEYLHSKNIIYRDLKPENLLLDRHGHLKITDFGFAKRVPDKTWTLCGTPDYLAPEVVSNKGYNKSVDWWSLGILIYEMLCGYTPFWDSGSPMKIYENILKGKVKYPTYIAPEAQDLLSGLITSDLTKRLGNLYGGAADVKGHPWFAEVTWDRLARKDIDAPYTPPVKAGAGDASQFDKYPEEQEAYGIPGGSDDFGHYFPDF